MTYVTLTDEGEDYGTLELRPGQDDSFSVSGYGNRGEIVLAIPLYAHEAQEIIDLLTPLAAKREEQQP